MNTFQNVARQANKVMAPLLNVPVLGSLLGKSMTEITYTGRRSGQTFRLVVNYRRRAEDEIVVGVALPDKKTWWRNFYPEPGPILVRLDGVDRPGTAVAKRSDKGTSVRIILQPLGITDAADHPGVGR
ncbi:hypothetical protein C6V83_09435 [Gordonia iterans]|uniref:Nitroreductase family deazaflavin-dependent oxidoreductase n=1 Tax=Gordonia iterans TaxID=1004901 RepID=A0A2S0KFJ4_9ACTN|nr:hypothetical protein [Gordonia iterans]AVM00462.1 hypothetical protein C6V83_09435 [Gordonia iterans]